MGAGQQWPALFFLKEDLKKMLTPNIVHHTMLRLRDAVLDDRTIRIADGLSCPACGTVIRATDPEETNSGWRITCSSCHRDLIVVEESHS
jgi:hypothetical protein